MISIDVTSAAATVTPPAVGTCPAVPAGKVVRMPAPTALYEGTGLPTAGTATAARLRDGIAAGTSGNTTGAFLGATLRPSVQTTALREFAVFGLPAGHASSTPGDLPPEDPLS